jgi:hypothetical protein
LSDIVRLADKLGVQFAFPTRTLHMVDADRENSPPDFQAPHETGKQFAEEIAKQTAIQQSQADSREQEAVETQQPSTKSATIDQAFVPPKESPPAPGESRVRPAEPTPVEQKITVVNRVPKTVTNILRRQFELMNAWLEPIHKATRGQRAEYRKLQEKIDACMNAYSKLIKRIDP